MAMVGSPRENLKFLIIEVTKQVEDTLAVLEAPRDAVIDRILTRDDYINNLRSVILNKTYQALLEARGMAKTSADLLRAINVVSDNLENIGDHCTNIVDQTRYLSSIAAFQRFPYHDYFDEILAGLRHMEEALLTRNVDQGLDICRAEFTIDRLYKDGFDAIMEELKGERRVGEPGDGDQVGDLLTTLFIIRYLERIGDCLLNIGEAIISASVGEKVKIHEYLAMDEGLSSAAAADDDDAQGAVSFETLAETRSGGRIGRVRRVSDEDAGRWVVFKEGVAAKLQAEKERIDAWEAIFPGLPPRVMDFDTSSRPAHLLLEYLPGLTFQKIVLEQPPRRVRQALDAIERVLTEVWDRTRQPGPVRAGFIRQIERRLPDVKRLHPGCDTPEARIGLLRIPSFKELSERLHALEVQLAAPFSVLIHGDFNADNVLYDRHTDRLKFIDLHRSRQADMVQDVTVFMMSNLRVPGFDAGLRARLTEVSLAFFRFAHGYAAARGDDTFDARVALGLVRSMITSTRFVANQAFATAMLLRARYLMERLIAQGGRPWSSFRVPLDVLRY